MTEARLFHQAVEAVIDGQVDKLQDLLAKHPGLATARAPADHRATLLHYVAANGVEDEHQRSPANAVAVARTLLEANAPADALAETYGGGRQQTPLTLLVSSVHPARAGVQADLVDVLIDGGAAVDGLDGDGVPIATAVAFGYTGAAEALARRGAKLTCLQVAAALGWMDAVEGFFGPDGAPRNGAGRPPQGWMLGGGTAQEALDAGFYYACLHGRREAAAFLLSKGADIGTPGHQGATALHDAACRGDLAMLDFLLERRAPLEVHNAYGGTPLDAAVYMAVNLPTPGVDYPAVAARLLAAGAELAAVTPLPCGSGALDALFRRHRAQT